MDTVGEILAARREEPLHWGVGLLGTVLLHAGILGLFLFASRLSGSHRFIMPHAVSVRLVPAGSLGLPKPAAAAARPEPARPVIEKPEETPAPSKKALPLPEKNPKKTAQTPHPARTAPHAKGQESGPAMELPGAGEPGAAGGGAAGMSFGTSVSSFDAADFNFSYYSVQLLTMIGSNWFKPTDQDVPSPVVHFMIRRDGKITDAVIQQSSGLPFVDRAALRAVLASSPLPPLPADYHSDTLGVKLVFK